MHRELIGSANFDLFLMNVSTWTLPLQSDCMDVPTVSKLCRNCVCSVICFQTPIHPEFKLTSTGHCLYYIRLMFGPYWLEPTVVSSTLPRLFQSDFSRARPDLFCFLCCIFKRGQMVIICWRSLNHSFPPIQPSFSKLCLPLVFPFVFCIIMLFSSTLRQLSFRAGGPRLFGINARLSPQTHAQVSLQRLASCSRCIGSSRNSLSISQLSSRCVEQKFHVWPVWLL